MTWYVHYKTRVRGTAGIVTVGTLPNAIKYACKLLDRGMEVSEIEGSGELKGMNAKEISLAYTEWKAKKALRKLVDRTSK